MLTKLRPIKTESDYHAALKEIESLFDAAPHSPECDRLDILTTLVEVYEQKHFPIEAPDPISAIQYYLEARGLSARDLVTSIGSIEQVNAILNRQQPLSLDVIRRLHKNLGIPAEVLIESYPRLIGRGIDKNFDGQKLQRVNFQGADLSNASFINTNLNEANLQDANLSNAKLIQTQLDRTNLTGTTLTGACIEDWGITSHTKLDEVKCKYIFMRSPTKEDPNPRRKPDNWQEEFEGNDFADFIKPIFDTLDLYHNQGVDPRAIAISWKKLTEDNPDANLRFAALEVKGENNLLLRLKAEPNADLSKLSADYFETYNYFKKLAAEEAAEKYIVLLEEKDDRINSLENFVKIALEKSSSTVNIQRGNYNENIGGNYNEG